MRGLTSPRTRRLVELALGYALDATGRPELRFDLAPQLADFGATVISEDERAAVSGQVLDAYDWCAARFPLAIRDPEGRKVQAIASISLGRSVHEGEYLTASSPHRPCDVFVAAPWPLAGIYRLGSLLAHEAMHQALYNRERIGDVARVRSLGYSPWKQQLRPGRLVWHAFWTFSTQFSLLVEAFLEEGGAMVDADPNLLDFIAEMDARIDCCGQSLEQFDLLPAEEAGRVEQALVEVRLASRDLMQAAPLYASRHARWSEDVAREIEIWSAGDLMRASAA